MSIKSVNSGDKSLQQLSKFPFPILKRRFQRKISNCYGEIIKGGNPRFSQEYEFSDPDFINLNQYTMFCNSSEGTPKKINEVLLKSCIRGINPTKKGLIEVSDAGIRIKFKLKEKRKNLFEKIEKTLFVQGKKLAEKFLKGDVGDFATLRKGIVGHLVKNIFKEKDAELLIKKFSSIKYEDSSHSRWKSMKPSPLNLGSRKSLIARRNLQE